MSKFDDSELVGGFDDSELEQAPPSGYGLSEKPGVVEQFVGGAKHAWDRAAAGLQSAAGSVGLPTGEDLQPLVKQGAQFVKETGPASTVGQITGDIAMSAPVALKVFKGLNAARGVKTAIAGETAVNAGYGALTADESKAGEGAAWGAGATVAGHGLAKALSAVRAGAKPTDDALHLQAQMNQAYGGMPPPAKLTPGQLAPEKGWLRKAENALAHSPFVGAPLRARQEDAMRGFQEVSRSNALHPAAAGSDAKTIASLKQSFSDAYEGLLSGKEVTFPSSVGNQKVPAHSAHLRESELKSAAAKLMKSPDPMQRMEGKRMMNEAKTMGKFWRSQLPPDAQSALSGIDDAYGQFATLEAASGKGVGTLRTPEDYTPKALLKELRKVPEPKAGKRLTPKQEQKAFVRRAEDSIGSVKPTTTLAGQVGAGTVALASVLGHVHPAFPVAAAAYGTKPGQVAARGAQRALTGDELAALARALRRGTAPAANTLDE